MSSGRQDKWDMSKFPLFAGHLHFMILDSLILIKSRSIFVLPVRYLRSSRFLEREHELI